MARQKRASKIIEEATETPHRDKQGLTGEQRAFLRARKTTLDDLEAFDLAKVTRADFENWLLEPEFETAYKEQVPKTGLEQARAHIDSLLPSAIRVLQDALQGKQINKVQMQAINALLKVGGLQRIYLDIQQVQIPVEAVIAIDMLRHGELPPPQLQELATRFFREETERLMPKALPPGQVVEGEVIGRDTPQDS